MQYLSTASARVFLSSKLSNHNTFRWIKNTKQELVREVKTAEEVTAKKRNSIRLPKSSHLNITRITKQLFRCTKRRQTTIKHICFPVHS